LFGNRIISARFLGMSIIVHTFFMLILICIFYFRQKGSGRMAPGGMLLTLDFYRKSLLANYIADYASFATSYVLLGIMAKTNSAFKLITIMISDLIIAFTLFAAIAMVYFNYQNVSNYRIYDSKSLVYAVYQTVTLVEFNNDSNHITVVADPKTGKGTIDTAILQKLFDSMISQAANNHNSIMLTSFLLSIVIIPVLLLLIIIFMLSSKLLEPFIKPTIGLILLRLHESSTGVLLLIGGAGLAVLNVIQRYIVK